MHRISRFIIRLSAPGLVAVAISMHNPPRKHSLNLPCTSLCDTPVRGQPKPPNDYIIVHPEFNYEEGDDNAEYSLKFEDGTMYQGETFHEQMHGLGKLKLYDGTIYIGTFVHGQLEGDGTIIGENSVYVGEIKDWLPHGLGKMTDAAGTVCEGRFYRGELNGHGTLTEIDGSTYDGQFEHNSPNGQGKYTCADYESVGLFENFTLKEGTITYTTGCVDQGTFVDKKLHGWGKSVWRDGTIVEGEYVNGEPEGVITVTREGTAAALASGDVTFKYYKLRNYMGI